MLRGALVRLLGSLLKTSRITKIMTIYRKYIMIFRAQSQTAKMLHQTATKTEVLATLYSRPPGEIENDRITWLQGTMIDLVSPRPGRHLDRIIGTCRANNEESKYCNVLPSHWRGKDLLSKHSAKKGRTRSRRIWAPKLARSRQAIEGSRLGYSAVGFGSFRT